MTDHYDVERTITSLGIGEALVTVLSPKGVPTPLEVLGHIAGAYLPRTTKNLLKRHGAYAAAMLTIFWTRLSNHALVSSVR